MGKVEIMHIIEALEGGVYTYIKDITRFFSDDKDINNTVVYSANRGAMSSELLLDELPKDVRLIEVEMRRELEPIHDLRATIQLKNLIKQHKPNIIHLHSSKAGALGRVASFLSGTKAAVFYTPHGYSFLRKDTSKLTNAMFYGIEYTLKKLFRGVTIACGSTEYVYAKKIGRSVVVSNWVDIATIEKYKREPNKKISVIGTMGRITAQRNPSLFNVLAQNNPKINFLWIGDGEDRDKLTSPNITITGWMMNDEDIFKILSTIDVYVQPSSWEGLPIALLEAMALGLPALVTPIIGNKDAVIHNENGYWFKNAEEFNRLLASLECQKIRQEMGQKGQDRCYRYFSMSTNIEQLKKIYLEDL